MDDISDAAANVRQHLHHAAYQWQGALRIMVLTEFRTTDEDKRHRDAAIEALDVLQGELRRVVTFALEHLPELAGQYDVLGLAPESWAKRDINSPEWDQLHRALLAVEAAAATINAAGKITTAADAKPEAADAAMQRMALAGDSEIMLLASRNGRSANDRMRDIAAVDIRFKGMDSNQWATLLDVSASAIRQTEAWIEWHPRDVDAA